MDQCAVQRLISGIVEQPQLKATQEELAKEKVEKEKLERRTQAVDEENRKLKEELEWH